jgi:hypothetical protein
MNTMQLYLYEVIDSRINTLDTVINKKLHRLFQPDSGENQLYPSFKTPNFSLSDARLLEIIEEHSHTKRLLLTLRSTLKPYNGEIILNLLSEDRFLCFQEHELRNYIEEGMAIYA